MAENTGTEDYPLTDKPRTPTAASTAASRRADAAARAASLAREATADDAPVYSGPLVVQWGSGGESRITPDDCEKIAEAIDNTAAGDYKSLFPIHGAFGALSLDINGTTLWLYTQGGAYIVGELLDPATVRPKSVPASGDVNISSLAPDEQAAIMRLLQSRRSK